MSASAAGGDVGMIAAARSCFSGYRFDGGTTNCLRVFVVPRWLGAAAVHLVSCVVVPGRACIIRSGVGIAFSLLARVLVISSVMASLAFSIIGEPRRRTCSRCLFIISYLVRRGRLRSHPPSCPSHLPGVISSHRGRLSCGGRRALPFISPCVSFSLSCGKRRGI